MNFIASIIKMIIEMLLSRSSDTLVKADPLIEQREQLTKQIQEDVSKAFFESVKRQKHAMLVFVCLGCLLMGGCFSRGVYVPDGTPVMLRETIRGAKVWVQAEDGTAIPTKIDLPEGWMCLPYRERGK